MNEYPRSLPHSDEDYAVFIDKNVHKFLPKFKGYLVDPTGFHPGWSWAAFFFTFWWFLYRKMYFMALFAFVTLWVPYLNLLVLICWGIAANNLYFRHATSKISELKAMHGKQYGIYLRDMGGVNSWVPWVALIVSGGFVLLAMLGLFGIALLASL